MIRRIIRKIPGFRPPKDLRKLITTKEKYVIFMRIDQRLFVVYDKIRKVEEHYHFRFNKWNLAVLDKHEPMYWKDFIVIGVNASDLTNAPFMPDDVISGEKKAKYSARAIRWMKEHCRPLISPSDNFVVKENISDSETYQIKGTYDEGEIYGYDKTLIEFDGFDPMVVSNDGWWSDNFNFAQELEDNRLFQFLHMWSMSIWDRLKLFLQDAAIVLLLILLIAMINPEAIRIGGT